MTTKRRDRDRLRILGPGALSASAAWCFVAVGCGVGAPSPKEAAPRGPAQDVSAASPPQRPEAPSDAAPAPRGDRDVASDEVLRAADALLASCKDRSKRLVEPEDWTRLRRTDHLEIVTGAASAKGGPRRWTRMLVPMGADVEAYVADGDDYFSAYVDGSPEARAALAKLVRR